MGQAAQGYIDIFYIIGFPRYPGYQSGCNLCSLLCVSLVVLVGRGCPGHPICHYVLDDLLILYVTEDVLCLCGLSHFQARWQEDIVGILNTVCPGYPGGPGVYPLSVGCV